MVGSQDAIPIEHGRRFHDGAALATLEKMVSMRYVFMPPRSSQNGQEQHITKWNGFSLPWKFSLPDMAQPDPREPQQHLEG